MSTVNNAGSTNPADLFASIAGPAKKTGSTTAAADLENRFLTLLMTQIKNQDPLNPLDNAQVTSQLAQLNTVNGIEKMNSTLAQLVAGFSEGQSMQAASMIGKNVMVAGNKLPLAGEQALGGVMLDGAAESVTVTIKNAAGKVVQTQSLGAQEAGSVYFAWDGKDADGNVQPEGNYTFSVEATTGDAKIPATAMQIGMVSAVTRNKTGFLLDLGALGDFSFQDVQKIL